MLKFSLLHPNAKPLTKGTEDSVGWDLATVEETILKANAITAIRTGIAVEFPPGMIGSVRPRSSMSKRGLIVILGTIDPDYRGEILALIHNTTPSDVVVHAGNRIAQLTLEATFNAGIGFSCVPYDELSKTERGTGGFGSSGR